MYLSNIASNSVYNVAAVWLASGDFHGFIVYNANIFASVAANAPTSVVVVPVV